MSDDQSKKVAIFMPFIDEVLGRRAVRLLQDRSGIAADYYLHNDVERRGFISVVNGLFCATNHKYIVYLAQDAYPGINWLKTAFDSMEATGAGLLAFNDGKWYGRLASFGMVRREWAARNYETGGLFFEGYNSHYADAELSDLARHDQCLIYNPNAVLVEVDFNKGMRWTSNPDDSALYTERKAESFKRK
jgi:hypothetical protein